MKILVLFGALSDEKVYSKILKELKCSPSFEVEQFCISAHRNPDELQMMLKNKKNIDLIIAGAGLAAHLPGVTAAFTFRPVIGIPVKAQFGGLDAVCSILQMPYGVPVLTYAADDFSELRSILERCIELKQKWTQNKIPPKIYLTSIKSPFSPKLIKEISEAKILAEYFGIELVESEKEFEKDQSQSQSQLRIELVELKEEEKFPVKFPHDHSLRIYVPILNEEECAQPQNMITLFELVNKGHLWVGVNNIKNAVLSWVELMMGEKEKIQRQLKKVREKKVALSLPPLLYQGSVKNVRGIVGEKSYYFDYSNRYSVFDWGEMPDLLESKGEALCKMMTLIYQYLGEKGNWSDWKYPEYFASSPVKKEMLERVYEQVRQKGINHHFEELMGDAIVKVKAVKVDPPVKTTNFDGVLNYDYARYQEKRQNLLIPLEVIFRWGYPAGSSLKKRLHRDQYRSEIGLDHMPLEGEYFPYPLIEFSTKLEPSDRFVSYQEAKLIAGLSDEEFENLCALSFLIACRLKDFLGDIDSKMELWDGKLEFAFVHDYKMETRSFMLVDAIGPDELRILYEGESLSKEMLRQFYHRSAWYKNIEKAKIMATAKGHDDWVSICQKELHSFPAPLSAEIKRAVESIYRVLANLFSDKIKGDKIFPDEMSLAELMTLLKKFK